MVFLTGLEEGKLAVLSLKIDLVSQLASGGGVGSIQTIVIISWRGNYNLLNLA